MKFRKDYLIVKRRPAAEKQGVKVYSYKACLITESFDLINGQMTHVIALRKEDCGRYLTKEELIGILDIMGMRRDGTMRMEKTRAEHVIYFTQAVDGEAA